MGQAISKSRSFERFLAHLKDWRLGRSGRLGVVDVVDVVDVGRQRWRPSLTSSQIRPDHRATVANLVDFGQKTLLIPRAGVAGDIDLAEG